jgi:hypothetical protein
MPQYEKPQSRIPIPPGPHGVTFDGGDGDISDAYRQAKAAYEVSCRFDDTSLLEASAKLYYALRTALPHRGSQYRPTQDVINDLCRVIHTASAVLCQAAIKQSDRERRQEPAPARRLA